MTFNNFVSKFNGYATDFDGSAGAQCVDLIKMYLYYVFDIKPQSIGNAEAYWRRYNELPYLHDNFERIANTPTFVPQKGDIAVWDKRHGKYGHVAICSGEGNTKYFYSYDQNWLIKKMHRVRHDYKGGFAGVLRPRNQIKLYGSKYQVGQKVRINKLCANIGAVQGDTMLVEGSDRKQFWVKIKNYTNGHVIGEGTIAYAQDNNYIVELEGMQFWITNSDIQN